MKKYLFIVLLIGVCFGQEIITTNKTYKNGNIKEITYHKVQGNRISKHRIDYYQQDGRLNISATYDKDEKFKNLTFYDFSNKKIECIVIDSDEINKDYEKKLQNGKWYASFEDGQLASILKWDSRNYEPYVYKFNGDMNLYREGKMGKNYRSGKWIWWYDNGNKESEGLYKNKKRHGKWVHFYEDGTKRKEIIWNNGEKTSEKEYN